jgi:hypothetical protein
VVIATHSADRVHLVERCVGSVSTGTALPDETIVVVDGNPAVEAVLRRRLPHVVKVVPNFGSGASQARNTGLRMVCSDLVAYIDDDADPDERWLESILLVFEQRPTVIGVGGRILPGYEQGCRMLPPELLWVVGCTYRGHRPDEGPISRPIGASMAFRTDQLRLAGGFSSSFGPRGMRGARSHDSKKTGSNEELALAMSLRRTFGGETLWYCPAAIVTHHVPRERTTARYLVHRCWVEGTTKADVVAFHGSAVMNDDRSYLFAVLLPTMARRFSAGLRRGDGRSLADGVVLLMGAGVTAAGYLTRRAMRRLRGRSG